MEGKGSGPQHVRTQKEVGAIGPQPKNAHGTDSAEQGILIQDVENFRSSHRAAGIDAVVTRVADRAMFPFFNLGDFVGGRPDRSPDPKRYLGKACIIEIGPENYLVRRIGHGNNHNLFLVPEDLTAPILVFDEVVSISEVIWHRRIHECNLM